MSWFKRNRSNNGSTEPSPSRDRAGTDPATCLDVFRSHWQQASVVINNRNRKDDISSDEVETVIHNFGQMITLLVHEDGDEGMPGPILHFFLEKDILDLFCAWCSTSKEHAIKLKHEQLRMFEMLISQSKQLLLIHKSVIRPLLKLLSACTEGNFQSSEVYDIEHRLVLVLHQVCVCISQQLLILESFFCTSMNHGPTKFLIFSLLIPYIHREGPVGQHARDALLLIMTLSAKHPHIGQYIANNSDFCPVLAAGLSGLYSSLPRKIPSPSDHWYMLTEQDCITISELQLFLNSLEFCNAVIQIAHPLVKKQLTKYIYEGFLLPVIGPALHQDISGLPITLLDTSLFLNSRDEVTTATAYLDLFLRRITEPALIRVFLVFILTDKYDEIVILDSLITRIYSSSRLSLVSLALFKTLVDLHCEDVMYQLVFKYLIPCTHVMVSQRRSVKDLDMYGKSAERFLSLKPACCTSDEDNSQPNMATAHNKIEARRNSTMSESSETQTDEYKNYETSYMEYLLEAQRNLERFARACRCWSAPYNGENPSPDSSLSIEILTQSECRSDNSVSDMSNESINSTATNDDKPPCPQVKLFEKELNNDTTDSVLFSQGKKLCDFNKNDSHAFNDYDLTLNSEECNNTSFLFGSHTNTSLSNLYDSLKSRECFIEFLNILDDSGSDDSLEQTLESIDMMFSSFGNFRDNGELGESVAMEKGSEKEPNDVAVKATPHKLLDDNSGTFNPGNTSTPSTHRLKDVSSYVEITISGETEEKSLTANDMLPRLPPSTSSPVSDVTMSQLTRTSDDLSFSLAQSPGGTVLTTSKYTSAVPNIGPFLTAIFAKLEGMMSNTLYTNLLLTDVISKLASYPQPLLRSFLLNHNLVFQPTVKSLLQVLSSVRHKVDTYSYAISNFQQLMLKARRNLHYREDMYLNLMTKGERSYSTPPALNMVPVINTTPETPTKEKRRMTVTELLFRKNSPKRPTSLANNKSAQLQRVPLRGGVGYRYINSKERDSQLSPEGTAKTWNAVYCAILLEEFLKELAAISQEHSVLTIDYFCH